MDPSDSTLQITSAEIARLDAFARRMASRLAGRGAEDLTQDVWLAALHDPPPSHWRLDSWFVGALKNLANQKRRADARRVRREGEVAENEPFSESPSEAVERFEAMRRVVDLVGSLDPALREAILMRYWENLPPREIAGRLGVPVATVKTRLFRAMRKLRQEMGGPRGIRHCGAALGLPWACREPSSGLGLSWIGGWAMSKKSLIGVALVVLMVTPIALWPDLTSVDVEEAMSSSSSTRERPSTRAHSIEDVRRPIDEPLAEEDVPPSAPILLLKGRVVGLQPAIPWTSQLHIAVIEERWDSSKGTPKFVERPDHSLSVSVSPAGDFEVDIGQWLFSVEDACRLRVEARDPMYETVLKVVSLPALQVRSHEETSVYAELNVRPAGVVTGVVLDESQRPIEGARVRMGQGDGESETTTDNRGVYRLKGLVRGDYALIASGQDASFPYRAASATVSIEVGQERHVDPLILGLGETLEGIVTVGGAPLEGLGLELRPFDEQSPLKRLWTETNAQGEFSFGGLDNEAYHLSLRITDALTVSLAVCESVDRRVQAPGQLRLDLDAVIVDVRAEFEGVEFAPKLFMSLEESLRERRTARVSTANGIGCVLVATEENVVIDVSAEGWEWTKRDFMAPRIPQRVEETIEIALNTKPDSNLWMELEAVWGESLDRGMVRIEGSRWSNRFLRGEEGPIDLGYHQPGSYELVIEPGAYWERANDSYYLPIEVSVDVPPNESVHLYLEADLGGRLLVQARDDQGESLAVPCTILDDSGQSVDVYFVGINEAPDGTIMSMSHRQHRLVGGALSRVHPCLAVGRYEVVIEAEEYRPFRSEVDVQRGRTVEIDVELQRY